PRLGDLQLSCRNVDAALGTFGNRLRGCDLCSSCTGCDGYASTSTYDRCSSLRQIRLRSSNRDFIVTRIELSENSTLLHVLVLFHGNGNHCAADSRIHGMDMAIDLSVVSGLPFREVVPRRVAADEQNKDDGNDKPFGA